MNLFLDYESLTDSEFNSLYDEKATFSEREKKLVVTIMNRNLKISSLENQVRDLETTIRTLTSPNIRAGEMYFDG